MSEQIKTIKSFVIRKGRMTKAQKDALITEWPLYGIEITQEQSTLNFAELFGNDNPVIMEIGFGNGDSLAKMALNSPEKNFLGLEVHKPGVGHLLFLIKEYGLKNVRILSEDAVHILETLVSDAALSGVNLFFPDPWHKRKHNKRRIVQDDFVELLSRKIMSGGIFHMATDWEDYAMHMAKVMERSDVFESVSETPFIERPESRPVTKFEKRGLRLGHGVWDLQYKNLK